jgi:hypothetical protein
LCRYFSAQFSHFGVILNGIQQNHLFIEQKAKIQQ